MKIRRFKFITAVAVSPESGNKRQKKKKKKLQIHQSSLEYEKGKVNCAGRTVKDRAESDSGESEMSQSSSLDSSDSSADLVETGSHRIRSPYLEEQAIFERFPKFGMTSVIGRRRDMEDAVAIHPSFFRSDSQVPGRRLDYFGIYDGHGCSHVAVSCKNRMHHLVKEELEKNDESSGWKNAMERSFFRMDEEVTGKNNGSHSSNCRCELQTTDSDAVGSTAVVSIVTPEKIIVANCGDSRAVLCCGGKAVPLSNDHKPDRPDELERIQAAGGRVIFWDAPRVLEVLAMSRAIGDNYLKPYESSVPEVTITDRTQNDECLILASDGLWDVVSNDTACGIARMCLRGQRSVVPPWLPGSQTRTVSPGESSDQACSDAALLLTKLALARNSTDNVSVVIVDLRSDTLK